MSPLKSLLLAVPALLLLACEAPVASEDPKDPRAGAPVEQDEALVAIQIIGGGTVTYDNPTLTPCNADGKTDRHSCPAVRYKGGSGSFTAKAAPGYKFQGWSPTFGETSITTVTNPTSPTQTIVPPGTAALTATFVLLVKPIHATFVQEAQSTTYRVEVENPDLDIVKVQWSGPNCGDWNPKDESFGAERTTRFEMTWRHPHPECDKTTAHAQVSIKARVTFKEKVFVCEYTGALDGDGYICRPE